MVQVSTCMGSGNKRWGISPWKPRSFWQLIGSECGLTHVRRRAWWTQATDLRWNVRVLAFASGSSRAQRKNRHQPFSPWPGRAHFCSGWVDLYQKAILAVLFPTDTLAMAEQMGGLEKGNRLLSLPASLWWPHMGQLTDGIRSLTSSKESMASSDLPSSVIYLALNQCTG